MVEGMIWMVFIFYLVYTLVPTFLIRRLGYGVFKSRTESPCAALTFDDGPDPQYTPQLLDLLARKGTRATFFVLGAKAEHYPDLIRRMHEEGHLVGLHNYMHHSNALMTPWKVRRTLEHSADVIERITGIRPVHYRPPWGVFNVFDFLLIRKFRIVLWSMAAFDWRSRGGTDKIKRKLIGKSERRRRHSPARQRRHTGREPRRAGLYDRGTRGCAGGCPPAGHLFCAY
ncbi:polysaccharide deacetylase family protein [Paenibacillus sp. HGF7]|uniref:polysaccharide deacetylase family protein n=1 Tax=Paenibacillus sp. HGF7 TaxID=944559 RepID=UPI00020D72A3|nr:polysaccharide deacetylase [Paenibacillus sp. HGF7]